MGDSDVAAVKGAGSNFSKADNRFQELKGELSEGITKNIPVIDETLCLIENALVIVRKFHEEEEGVSIQSIDYQQVILSLNKYKTVAFLYDETSEIKYRNQLYEISGHIVDRISQKVLEWAGKESLQKFYDQLKGNLNKLNNVTLLLQSSADNLNSYLTDTTADSLHSEYKKDYRKYKKLSKNWLIAFSVSAFIFIVLLIFSVVTFPAFVKSYISSLSIKDVEVVIFYVLIPRFTLAIFNLYLVFSFWKNYQTYKHLEIVSKTKLNVAKLMPIIRMNTDDPKEFSTLQFEFIRQMSNIDETGFLNKRGKSPLSLEK